MTQVILLSIIFVVLVIGFMILLKYTRQITSPMRNLVCIAFKSQDICLQMQHRLIDEEIYFAHWTPSSPDELHPPKEFWVKKVDLEKVKGILTEQYKIEITPTAIIVLAAG